MFDIEPITDAYGGNCGPVCLKMLLSYYNIDVPLDTLIEECNVRRIGCTLADINRVGRLHGMEMHSYELDDEAMLASDRPAIINWKYNHFVLFCGLNDAGKVIINDPSRGRTRVGESTFCCYFNAKVASCNGEMQDI